MLELASDSILPYCLRLTGKWSSENSPATATAHRFCWMPRSLWICCTWSKATARRRPPPARGPGRPSVGLDARPRRRVHQRHHTARPGPSAPDCGVLCESRNGLHSLDAQPVGLIDLSSGADSGQWQWTPLQTNDNTSAADSIAWSAGTNPSLTLPASARGPSSSPWPRTPAAPIPCRQTLCILPPTSIWLPTPSPNGDGANDWLRPRGSGIARWTMTVHDRWGQRLWKADNKSCRPEPPCPPPPTADSPGMGWRWRRPGSTPFPSKPPLMGHAHFRSTPRSTRAMRRLHPLPLLGALALCIPLGHNGRPRGGGAGSAAARTGAPRRLGLGTGGGCRRATCRGWTQGREAFTPNGWAPVGEWATAGRHNARTLGWSSMLDCRLRVDGRPPRRRGRPDSPDKGWNGAAGLGLAGPLDPRWPGLVLGRPYGPADNPGAPTGEPNGLTSAVVESGSDRRGGRRAARAAGNAAPALKAAATLHHALRPIQPHFLPIATDTASRRLSWWMEGEGELGLETLNGGHGTEAPAGAAADRNRRQHRSNFWERIPLHPRCPEPRRAHRMALSIGRHPAPACDVAERRHHLLDRTGLGRDTAPRPPPVGRGHRLVTGAEWGHALRPLTRTHSSTGPCPNKKGAPRRRRPVKHGSNLVLVIPPHILG